jgi:hypothetical protein
MAVRPKRADPTFPSSGMVASTVAMRPTPTGNLRRRATASCKYRNPVPAMRARSPLPTPRRGPTYLRERTGRCRPGATPARPWAGMAMAADVAWGEAGRTTAIWRGAWSCCCRCWAAEIVRSDDDPHLRGEVARAAVRNQRASLRRVSHSAFRGCAGDAGMDPGEEGPACASGCCEARRLASRTGRRLTRSASRKGVPAMRAKHVDLGAKKGTVQAQLDGEIVPGRLSALASGLSGQLPQAHDAVFGP